MSPEWFGPFSLPTWLLFCPPRLQASPFWFLICSAPDFQLLAFSFECLKHSPTQLRPLDDKVQCPLSHWEPRRTPDSASATSGPINGACGKLSHNFSCCWTSSYTSIPCWESEAASLTHSTKHDIYSIMIPKDTRGEVMETDGGDEGDCNMVGA